MWLYPFVVIKCVWGPDLEMRPARRQTAATRNPQIRAPAPEVLVQRKAPEQPAGLALRWRGILSIQQVVRADPPRYRIFAGGRRLRGSGGTLRYRLTSCVQSRCDH